MPFSSDRFPFTPTGENKNHIFVSKWKPGVFSLVYILVAPACAGPAWHGPGRRGSSSPVKKSVPLVGGVDWWEWNLRLLCRVNRKLNGNRYLTSKPPNQTTDERDACQKRGTTKCVVSVGFPSNQEARVPSQTTPHTHRHTNAQTHKHTNTQTHKHTWFRGSTSKIAPDQRYNDPDAYLEHLENSNNIST